MHKTVLSGLKEDSAANVTLSCFLLRGGALWQEAGADEADMHSPHPVSAALVGTGKSMISHGDQQGMNRSKLNG